MPCFCRGVNAVEQWTRYESRAQESCLGLSEAVQSHITLYPDVQRTLRLKHPRKPGSVDATYHSVFAPGAPQTAIHDKVGQVVDDALAGVNSCIMTYGTTGTGKTHTMIGPPNILTVSGEGEHPCGG